MNPVGQPIDLSTLGNDVRHWVYYDTTIANLNRQVSQARQQRDKIEQEIIGKLKRANYEKAILQIAGGRIVLAEDRHSQPLSFRVLEELLHGYFTSKPTLVKDETADILKYIRAHRQVEVSQKLKKQMTVPPAPQT